jgi:hypothetical protein
MQPGGLNLRGVVRVLVCAFAAGCVGTASAPGDAPPMVDADARGDGEALPALPNLTLGATGLRESLHFEPRGTRRALAFQVQVRNTGEADLELAEEESEGALGTIPCDGSDGVPELLGWSVRGGGVQVGGTLPTLCLGAPDSAGQGGAPACTAHRLPAGESVAQPQAPHCAFADITELEPGEYELEVMVNPSGRLPEQTLEDNRVTVDFAMDRHDVCRQGYCGTECCYDSADPCSDGGCAELPDLAPLEGRAAEALQVTERAFSAGGCALEEGCVVQAGVRRLLLFSTTIVNHGPGDVVLGRPGDSPHLFEWAPCHGHSHLIGFARYRLLHDDGTAEAAEGHKQSFCLFDTTQVTPGAAPPRFTCGFQGMSAGWADTYGAGLDCQWIDITGVAPGRYFVEVAINAERVIAESDYGNNVVRVPVYLYDDGTVCAPEARLGNVPCPLP